MAMPTASSSTSTKTRTRTGCLTCRGRKLKCDEQKPTCGQCRKSKRQCQPADGPFRHEHNASITGTNSGKKRLDKFYKYRQEYDNDNYFLPVKNELRWIHVIDPYADDDALPSSGPNVEYQQVAVSGLAALTGHAEMPVHHDNSLVPQPHHYSLPSHPFGHISNVARPGDVESLLNPEGAGNIDPSLDLPPVSAGEEYVDMHGEEGGSKGLEDIATHAALYAALQQESDIGVDVSDNLKLKHELDGARHIDEHVSQ